ncbi:MAG: hypothetical protein FWB76_04185 [Oscillospiraceae bacterium]|nr:hypothetical protein [Oscillospiraceae bacterium]
MRKLLALLVVLLVLAGCAAVASPSAQQQYNYTAISLPPLHMAVNPTDEFMAQFNNTHEHHCRNVSQNISNTFASTLVFWTDEPLHDFAYARHTHWRGRGERFFFWFSPRFAMAEFLPGDAFVLQGRFIYANQMSYPGVGFAFYNQAGEQQHVVFHVNPYGNVPYVSMRFVEYALPNWPWCDICGVYCQKAYELAHRPSTEPLHLCTNSSDEFLQTFSTVHVLTHEPDEFTPPLVLWTDEPVRNVSFITTGWHEDSGGAYAAQTLLTLPLLHPGEALVLHVAVSHSTPWQGIAFVDTNGVQHHMHIAKSWAGGCIPSIGLHPFVNTPQH